MQKCSKGQPQSRDLSQTLMARTHKKKFRFNRERAVRKQSTKVTDSYQIGSKIGSGSYGEVFKVHHKQLHVTRALKIIKKKEQCPSNNPEEELSILKELDHPTVLKIYQYFENEHEWEIVTEYFEGRELFDVIRSERGLSERKAALIFHELCIALSYIHSHNIVHRDIKPENILVRKTGDSYQMKLIDWGLGSKAVQQLIRRCGTPEYCAPEVIKGSYGTECDLWSLGVVLYVMLVGRFPFKSKTTAETLKLVTQGEFNLQAAEWSNISADAKILIAKLLKKDPKQRIKASECLLEPWVAKNVQQPGSPEETKLLDTLENLRQIQYDNQLQAVVMSLLHNYERSSKQEQELKKEFELLDLDKDGVLGFEEIKQAYEKIYSPVEAERITEELFYKIDLNHSNSIEYSQFIAFGTSIREQFSKQELREVFRKFDENDDGVINRAQLNSMLTYERLTQSNDFNELIREVDKNGDGVIDIDEFVDNVGSYVKRVLQEQGARERGAEETPWEEITQCILEMGKLRRKEVSTLANLQEKEEGQDKESQ